MIVSSAFEMRIAWSEQDPSASKMPARKPFRQLFDGSRGHWMTSRIRSTRP